MCSLGLSRRRVLPHKRAFLCRALCLAIGLLAGCTTPAAPPEPVTITFVVPGSSARYYEELLPLFNEEHPYITVEFTSLRNIGQFEQLGAGDGDAFELYPTFLDRLYEEEALLDPRIYADYDPAFAQESFYPCAWELGMREGQRVALPAAIQPAVMVYNEELFDRYGVPYPAYDWTWDDFLSAAQALRDPDARVFGYALQYVDSMYLRFAPQWVDPLYFVYQHGGQIFDPWALPTRTTFDDPATVDAVAWYAALVREHDVAPDRAQARAAYLGDPRGILGFGMGKAGMIILGPFERFPSMGQQFERGYAPLPRGVLSATFCTGIVHAISAESQQPEAAWKWLAFLSEQLPAQWMPPRIALAESKAFENRVGIDVADVSLAAMEADLVLPLYVDEARLDEIERFYEAVLRVCEGETTAADALGQAQGASQLR
jgi:multiple sugar transport system substrate-binding protein